MQRTFLKLIGDFAVYSSDSSRLDVKSRKAACLLALLARSPDMTLSRRKIAQFLWSEKATETGLANLRRLISDLPSALKGEVIVVQRDSISIDGERCLVDLDYLLRERFDIGADVANAISADAGELFSGLDGVDFAFDDWLRQERSHVSTLLDERLTPKLADFESMNPEIATAISLTLLRIDETNEEAAYSYMRLMDNNGRSSSAIKIFNSVRERVLADFGISPSEKLVSLYNSIKTRRGGSASFVQDESPKYSENLTERAGLRDGRLSVIILPTENQTGSPSLDGSIDGLSDELSAQLHKYRWINTKCYASFRSFNISSLSEFSINKENYVLQCALLASRGRHSIRCTLTDFRDGSVVFSDRFEVSWERIDEVFLEISSAVAPQINERLFQHEICLIDGRPSSTWTSRDRVFRAISNLYILNENNFGEAGHLLSRAVEDDPRGPLAHSWKAYWHTICAGQGWLGGRAAHLERATEHSQIAVALDPLDAQALAISGHVAGFLQQDFDRAIEIFDRAVELNPNLGFVHAYRSATLSYTGKSKQAIDSLSKYKDLSPFHPHGSFLDGLFCVAHSFDGSFEETVRWGRRLMRACPDFVNGYKHTISALANLGRQKEAQEYAARLLRLEPGFCVADFVNSYPMVEEIQRERIIEGLKKTGLK